MLEGRTFHKYCKLLDGYRFFNKSGFEVFKWQLYWNYVNPYKLMQGKTKYKVIIRKDDQ